MIESPCLQTDVRALVASPMGDYILSGAEDERCVSVWKAEKKERNAVCLLSVEYPAIHLDTEMLFGSEDDETGFVALAVSETGVVYIWQCRHDTDHALRSTLWAKIQVQSG